MDKVAKILFNQSSNGVCFVAPDGQFLQVNQRLCEMLGYSEDELLDLDFQSLTHPNDLPTDIAHVQQVLANEIDSYGMVKRYFHGVKRSWMWAKLSVNCDRNPDGTVKYFISQIEEISTRHLEPEQWSQLADVKTAIALHQLVLHWQPIVSLATSQAVGYEGLIRWEHPEKGLLYPGAFLPLLEATQNLYLLTHYVLSILEAGLLPQDGWASINIDNDSIQRPDWAIKSEILSSSKAHIEILETALVSSDVERLIHQLRQQGVAIAIDDYASGYSNPELLTRKELPCDILKVDQGLIQKLGESDRAYELCKSIVQFCKQFGLETIAEGVETQRQAAIVKELGFDMVQGRLYGWPAPLGGSSSA